MICLTWSFHQVESSVMGPNWISYANMTKNIYEMCHSNGSVCYATPNNCLDQYPGKISCAIIAGLTSYHQGIKISYHDNYHINESIIGLFLFGKYDPVHQGNQSVGVVLNTKYDMVKNDLLFVRTQDDLHNFHLMQTTWTLNDNLQPHKWYERAHGYVNSKDDLDEEYFVCSQGFYMRKDEWYMADELPSRKYYVTLADIVGVDLEPGSSTVLTR